MRSARAYFAVAGDSQGCDFLNDTAPLEEVHTAPAPLGVWQVPTLDGAATVDVLASPGRITAVVGPNGSGKSALGYWFSQHTRDTSTRRVIAHRRLWFEYAGPNITAAQRPDLERNIALWGAQVDSRWRDHANESRAGFVLFDLLGQINDYNARFVELSKQGFDLDYVQAELGESLLDKINMLLRSAHLGVTLVTTDRTSFEAVPGRGGDPYPISEMSDGEKSALLLAAEVMTVPRGSVIIVDEPERHLHRLISAPLIEAVVEERKDCHFVVLTHDLELASALPRNATTLGVVTQTAWSADREPIGWDIRFLDPGDEMPESARQAILGGRQQVLFVEGERHSLDLRLYQVLFPDWTLSPVGGCDQVIRAVGGLLTSDAHHWVRGRGIVDGDGRNANEREALAKKGILSLQLSEVESLYYSEAVRGALAVRQGETLEKVPAELLAASTEKGLAALRGGDTTSRLAASVAQKQVHRTLVDGLPSRTDLADGTDPISVSVASPFPDLQARLEELLAADNLDDVVREYPIRDTGVKGEVAGALGFKSVDDYEAAALARIRIEPQLRDAVRDLVGQLPEQTEPPAT